MKLVIGLAAFVGVLVWLGIGLFIAQGPQPEIIVPAEVITKVGPLNLTNTLITSWVVMALMILFFWTATRSMKLLPTGAQNFAEAVISFLVGQVEEIAGEKNGRRFFAVVATIFLFVICNNWFGLMPFFNAFGKHEDVHHHVFHELTSEHPKDLTLGEDGRYIEGNGFGGWIMDGDGGLIIAKPRTKAIDFEVHEGETPGEAADRYIVFVAKHFAGFEATDEELEHPTAEMVAAAAATLDGTDGHPHLLLGEAHAADDHGAAAAHGLASPALHQTITGIDFEGAKKFGLVIPLFRGAFSDVNNTLALGIVAFLCIEFWGFQALGFGYLKKFFNLNGVNAFVGILELLSEFIRIISFTFRLFGNIFAGEVLILMLTFLMPFLFVDIIYGLELFVGFIQAAVFALLTLVFAVGAVEHHGEDEHHEGHHGEDAGADAHHAHGAAAAH
ncbi:MAG: F0F1 ATP synthase subunit A [Dehalococcoidia bacterium]|nr:F0F1 ATP synthase subunit A [Dehalococcoidia bacterium]